MWWSLVRRRRGATTVCALLLTATVVTGCSGGVTGTAEPEAAGRVGSGSAPPDTAQPPASRSGRDGSPAAPAELILPPERFPDRYPAVTLPASAVAQAAPDLTGVPTGAKVDPPGCLPPAQDLGPAGTAMVVGTDDDTRATLTVEVVAGAEPLVDLVRHLSECGRFSATHRGVTATVTAVRGPDPAAPVAGVETLALTRTVESGGNGTRADRHLQVRVAQIGDIRILVTYMAFDDAVTDEDALDAVFRDAVTYAVNG